MYPERGQGEGDAADSAIDGARRSAERLKTLLGDTAEALEESARLAERHAQRREESGRLDDAAHEHRAAHKAREAAERARSQAEALANKPAVAGPSGDVAPGPAYDEDPAPQP